MWVRTCILPIALRTDLLTAQAGADSFTTALEQLEKVQRGSVLLEAPKNTILVGRRLQKLLYIRPLRDLITKSAQALALPADPILLWQQELDKCNVSTTSGFATTYFFSTKTKFRNKVDIGQKSSGRTSMGCIVMSPVWRTGCQQKEECSERCSPLASLSVTKLKGKKPL